MWMWSPCTHHEAVWGAEIHTATDTETSASDWSAARLGRFTHVEGDHGNHRMGECVGTTSSLDALDTNEL